MTLGEFVVFESFVGVLMMKGFKEGGDGIDADAGGSWYIRFNDDFSLFLETMCLYPHVLEASIGLHGQF